MKIKASTVRKMKKMGRRGDTMLAHISPQEGELLEALGGSGTKNPKTGLPEYYGFVFDVGSGLFDPRSFTPQFGVPNFNPSGASIGGAPGGRTDTGNIMNFGGSDPGYVGSPGMQQIKQQASGPFFEALRTGQVLTDAEGNFYGDPNVWEPIGTAGGEMDMMGSGQAAVERAWQEAMNQAVSPETGIPTGYGDERWFMDRGEGAVYVPPLEGDVQLPPPTPNQPNYQTINGKTYILADPESVGDVVRQNPGANVYSNSTDYDREVSAAQFVYGGGGYQPGDTGIPSDQRIAALGKNATGIETLDKFLGGFVTKPTKAITDALLGVAGSVVGGIPSLLSGANSLSGAFGGETIGGALDSLFNPVEFASSGLGNQGQQQVAYNDQGIPSLPWQGGFEYDIPFGMGDTRFPGHPGTDMANGMEQTPFPMIETAQDVPPGSGFQAGTDSPPVPEFPISLPPIPTPPQFQTPPAPGLEQFSWLFPQRTKTSPFWQGNKFMFDKAPWIPPTRVPR